MQIIKMQIIKCRKCGKEIKVCDLVAERKPVLCPSCIYVTAGRFLLETPWFICLYCKDRICTK
jgi:hypothetical protein